MPTGPVTTAARTRVARPVLARRLSSALGAGSVLLVAGAGYGKTMALEEALSVRGLAAVWLSCGGLDPGQLLIGLVRRLRTAVPGLADVVAERLSAPGEPVDVRSATLALRDELERLLVEPLVIVLDDAEELERSRPGLELVELLLRSETGRLSLAVATRRPLALQVAKLRAAGRLAELGPAELAFGVAEIAELLRLRLGREPWPDEVDALMARTEGWPLGVALSALGDHRAGMEHAPRAALFPFLAEEVLDRLGDPLRGAVIDSSVARVLTPQVMDALGLPEDFIAQAERVGLVLKPRPGERQAWSHHPLFREFLLERLGEERPEPERRRLHGQVARALVASGEAVEAVDHWLAAAEWHDAVNAMEAVGQDIFRTSPETLRAWLARVPEALRAEPACLFLEGQLEWGAGQVERARPLLTDAVAGYAERGDVPREWLARWILADTLFSLGDFDALLELSDGFDGPAGRAAGPIAVGVGFFRAVVYGVRGDVARAEAVAARLRSDPEISAVLGDLDIIARAFGEAAAGRIDGLVASLSETTRRLEILDPLGRVVYARATLALLLMECGERDPALAMWDRCRKEAERLGLDWVLKECYLQRALLHAQSGRLREAEAAFAAGAQRAGTGWRDVILHKASAAIAALRGDAPAAIAAAERALERVAPGPINFGVWAACEMAPVLAVSGAPERAREAVDTCLGRLDQVLPGERGRYHRARLLAVRAWLKELVGEDPRHDLARCFGEAGDNAEKIVRLEWERFEPLVWRGLERQELDVQRILGAVERAFPGGFALMPLIDHPLPEVRRAAVGPAVASGHPRALARLDELAKDPDAGVVGAVAIARQRLATPPPLAYELLGGFRLRRARWEVEDHAWGRPLAARLVRFLLVHRDASVAEDLLFEAFWPDKPAEAARHSLAVALSLARGVLDPPGAERSVVEVRERCYRLRLRECDRLDVAEFEQAAAAAVAQRGPSARMLLGRAESLWTGEPLPEDRYAEWTFAWRERLIDRYLQVLAALVEACTQTGDHLEAARAAHKAVELDPLNEGAHRELMAAYARAGRTSHALRQYLECRRALVDELGVEPSQQTSDLQARILAGEPV